MSLCGKHLIRVRVTHFKHLAVDFQLKLSDVHGLELASVPFNKAPGISLQILTSLLHIFRVSIEVIVAVCEVLIGPHFVVDALEVPSIDEELFEVVAS